MAEQASFFGAVWPIVPPPAPPPPPAVSIPNPPPAEAQHAGREDRAPTKEFREFRRGGVSPPAERAEKSVHAVDAAEKRRAYNREYMRRWRERNLERYREYNRSYQRKTALRRKLRSLDAPESQAKNMCWYRCGRPATQTIERVDPRTWQTQRVPYCGHC